MRAKLFYPCLFVIFFMFSSCQKGEFNIEKPNVDKFVQLLKSGDYLDEVGHELPDFSFNHIEKLTYYLKDTTSLSMFPANPVSSKYTHPKILNECLFWTIDGIRFGTKYPSLEPCLIDTLSYSELTGYSKLTGMELLKLSEKYINWYNEYKENPSEILKAKNLFEITSYKWL